MPLLNIQCIWGEKVLACSCSAWARMPPERYRCSVRMPSGAQCPAHIGLPKDGHTYTCEEHLRLGILGTSQRVAGAGHTMAAAITKRGPVRTVKDLAALRRIVGRKRPTGGAKKGPTSRKARAMMPSSLDTGASLGAGEDLHVLAAAASQTQALPPHGGSESTAV